MQLAKRMNAVAPPAVLRAAAPPPAETSGIARHVVELSKGRRAWLNALDLAPARHWMCGLLEVDVTLARQRIGGIARKPAVVDDRIEARDLLSLTVLLDHDMIDGAPATRFVRRLVELIELPYGLEANTRNARSTP